MPENNKNNKQIATNLNLNEFENNKRIWKWVNKHLGFVVNKCYPVEAKNTMFISIYLNVQIVSPSLIKKFNKDSFLWKEKRTPFFKAFIRSRIAHNM